MTEICPDGEFYGCEMQLKYNQCCDTCTLLPNNNAAKDAASQAVIDAARKWRKLGYRGGARECDELFNAVRALEALEQAP